MIQRKNPMNLRKNITQQNINFFVQESGIVLFVRLFETQGISKFCSFTDWLENRSILLFFFNLFHKLYNLV